MGERETVRQRESEKKKVGIHQPNFNPYLGVIAKYLVADTLVHLDTVQFVKNEFQNRNRVLVDGRPFWLTVPVLHRFGQTIRETRIDTRVPWRKKHLRTLSQAYSRTPRFRTTLEWLEEVYSFETESLAEWNLHFLRQLFLLLGIETPTKLASELPVQAEDPDERLIRLCQAVASSVYLAGSGGRAYMRREKWNHSGIEVRFLDYRHPVYPQGLQGFVPYCGVLDLIFRFEPRRVREMALSGVSLSEWDTGEEAPPIATPVPSSLK